MSPVDFNAIMQLKKTAMKRCQERILEAAAEGKAGDRKGEDTPECYGISQVVKKRHGL